MNYNQTFISKDLREYIKAVKEELGKYFLYSKTEKGISDDMFQFFKDGVEDDHRENISVEESVKKIVHAIEN